MAKSIAVAGKGGTGKTTIAALIVRYLCEKKRGPVLAIDADADANLGTLLGIKTVKTIGDLREEVLREMKNLPAGMTKANYVEAGLHQIIEEAQGFDLVTMGRGEGNGCYCSLNNLIRKFSADLAPSYSWIVLDNEAGLEHISRRTTSNIDALLIVVNDNPISFDTARRIKSIVKDLKNNIGRGYVVTNMIREKNRQAVQKMTADLQMEYIGDIPADESLQEAIFSGGSLMTTTKTKAIESLYAIMDFIGGGDDNT